MPEIKIIPERCKSCGYCIKYCPKNVIAMGHAVNQKGYEYVEALRQQDCTGCCFCGYICPEGAIEVYK
ncbi:4Fe-4S binding protein [Enterococcus hirae]|nr:4Fe-4S binding protein [Enterococcaceae bacterium]MCI1918697.1 4Fe-4S binding protein [Enterococcaceae bacterium]MDM8212443.1 4Fe-4S binding protein [Enterococcus hirae]